MSLRIEFTLEGRADFLETLVYLAERNPPAAEAFRARIEGTLRRLAAGRLDGREVVLSTGAHVRRWVLAPWVIYDERTADTLRVLRIYHGARAPLEP